MLCHSGFEIVRGGQYNSNKKQTILNACLVAVSLGFFAWDNIGNVGILLSLVIFNYIAGMAWKECRGVLLLGIFYDLSVLVKYKYLSLILSAFHVGKTEELLAPLGISFIIFHCISYLMDLYQKKAEPEHNLIDFALYITFFPKLIQGPIVKYRDMKAEIKQRKQISFDSLADGMGRFIIGLSKKVLIADILSQIVTDIFNLLSSWGMDVPTAWIGYLAYTVQIYMDFSGYSDMAIGLGRIFGFHMQENFNFPYRSQTITEFWRRWHISLGNWFRDYLYIPLGGNRRGNVYINLFLVLAATGIWHGAGILFFMGNWTWPVCGNRAENTKRSMVSENSWNSKMGDDYADCQYRLADFPFTESGADVPLSAIYVWRCFWCRAWISAIYLAVFLHA